MQREGARLIDELGALRSDLADLMKALQGLDEACLVADGALRAGSTPIEVYLTSRFAPARDEFFAALDRFSQQLTRVRAEGIRLHVDVEGRSLTEVAALVGRSRQFVTRLYRQASSD